MSTEVRASKRLRTAVNLHATSATCSKDNPVDFRVIWKSLRRTGWTSKPPSTRSLDNRYRYVRPGGDPNGTDGQDYFLGEKALVDHFNAEHGAVLAASGSVESDVYGKCDPAVDVAIRPEAKPLHHKDTGIGVVSGARQAECKTTTDELEDKPVGVESSTVESEIASTTIMVDESPVHGTATTRPLRDGRTQNAGVTRECDQPQNRTSSTGTPPHRISAGDMASPKCAVCNTSCSSQRTCTACGAFLHHFCSHDVCKVLRINGPDGQLMQDFGDACYCSKQCYDATLSKPEQNWPPLPVARASLADAAALIGKSTSKRKRQAMSSTGNTSHGSSNKLSATATSQCKQKLGAQVAKSVARKKAQSKPTKATATAVALRKELLCRTQTAAERFIGANVAFSPAEESWMNVGDFPGVGASYLLGVVTSYETNNMKNVDEVAVPTISFQIRWTSTAFQGKKKYVHHVGESVVYRGIEQYVEIKKKNVEFGESWSALCNMVPKYTNLPSLTDEFDEVGEGEYREWSVYKSKNEFHIDLCPKEVESIEGMTFSPTASLGEVPGLFAHADGTTTTKLRPESNHLFGNTATSSFFAFLPLSLWKQVVVFSNSRALRSENRASPPIELEELMTFLGIQWYMTLFDKGELRNYWFNDEEDNIFPGSTSTSLATVMSWKRYLHIRSNLSFRADTTPEELARDPAARVRPLITMLKNRCSRHVIPGRNVAVDEASIACRSKYARNLIVYNPRKPTGKFHFELYVCCCSTTWLVLGFKLHCASELHARLDNVISDQEIDNLATATAKSSDIRKHVLEVTNSLKGSRRIVNTDNFYTSCLLLESLRTVGLYGRGTVRFASKHFPKFTMLGSSNEKRGAIKQGVCLEKHIVAASWFDGSVVNVISNADDSGTTTIFRRIRQDREAFRAPTCIREYNSAMQGVDRHDQLRSRFSVANGHTFKKWHKKLAMAMIDIARCNAYICHQIACGREQFDLHESDDNDHQTRRRDEHRSFVSKLVREMFDGTWKKSLHGTDELLFSNNDTGFISSPTQVADEIVPESAGDVCVARESWIVLQGRSRAMRECTVCRFECRKPTQKTDYCERHKVALCKRTYPVDSTKPHLCQETSWSCWQKYHGYYLPKSVYNLEGRLMRSSSIYKAQAPFLRAKSTEKTTS